MCSGFASVQTAVSNFSGRDPFTIRGSFRTADRRSSFSGVRQLRPEMCNTKWQLAWQDPTTVIGANVICRCARVFKRRTKHVQLRFRSEKGIFRPAMGPVHRKRKMWDMAVSSSVAGLHPHTHTLLTHASILVHGQCLEQDGEGCTSRSRRATNQCT